MKLKRKLYDIDDFDTPSGDPVFEPIKLKLETEGEVALIYRLLQATGDHDVLSDFEVKPKTLVKILDKFEELSNHGIGWPVLEVKVVF